MISKLRHKIFIGILLLAVLLAASGTIVLHQFLLLNRSVTALIEDNYKTIQACQNMLEALEREDSGILLLALGNWEKGRYIIDAADSVFMASMAVAAGNVTELHEEERVAAVRAAYNEYKTKWKKPIVDTDKEGDLNWYVTDINPDFLQAKEAVYALMKLNQNSMYDEASVLKERSYRAIMPGIVAIVAVIVFAFLFNYFLRQSLMAPLYELIAATEKYRANMSSFSFSTKKTDDEFRELEQGIQKMISKVHKFYDQKVKANQ
jgi:methyl-accepting chemotaxis protein